jgi:tetratricopeptide (TPR) repeat protein
MLCRSRIVASSRTRGLASACLTLTLALACGTAPSTVAPERRPDLAASLVQVAEQALDAGDLAEAEARFQRALDADPTFSEAHLGLARVAIERGDLKKAAPLFRKALSTEDTALDAQVGLARIAVAQGRRAEAQTRLRQVLSKDPLRSEAHAELAALTGPAPRGPADLDEALRRAREHPYDLRAAVQAASALADAGRKPEATRRLESILWLADLDPASAKRAWALLRRLEPTWRDWQLVPVHSYADESIRGDPGWRYRLRLTWLGATRSLGSLLRVRFVPASIRRFASADVAPSLDSIHTAFRNQAGMLPREGIVAVLTDREPPRGRRSVRLGQAEFLGRRLVVRLDPEGGSNRVLLHELLHLYGGVHVAAGVKSLMNPSGKTEALDSLNAAIVRELGVRRFLGNLETDVFELIDLEATTAAYENALRANLVMRHAGMTEAIEISSTSPVAAARTARRVQKLDPHLGDVARFIAVLYQRGEHPASAAFLLEKAARLYGPDSARGRQSAREAERIWDTLLPRETGR